MADGLNKQAPHQNASFARPLRPLLVFTDLDGTLLDHNDYSFTAAKPALAKLKALKVPVIPVTSKTLAELETLMTRLDDPHPCIAENGALIACPPNYFSDLDEGVQVKGWQVIELAPSYQHILEIIQRLRQEHGFHFRGFNDMAIEDIVHHTGLATADAERAMQRLCTEPLLWDDDEDALRRFEILLHDHNLQLLQGGRFWHVMGLHDKASAMARLCELYRNAGFEEFQTIALGDSPNDIAMLSTADIAVVIQRKDGSYLSVDTKHEQLFSEAPGPAGWNQSILNLLARFDLSSKTNRGQK